MPKNFDFFTAEEVAEEFGITRRAVMLMIVRGDLPNAFKIDPDKETSSWLIPKTDVEKLKKQRAQASST